jgi:hypothetical protein
MLSNQLRKTTGNPKPRQTIATEAEVPSFAPEISLSRWLQTRRPRRVAAPVL